MAIAVLAEAVISQIAAGEVVERPTSVVKELLENALDAGAHSIRVDVEGGGRSLIRVSDDGAGICAAEVELAFARHATSKLRHAADLSQIMSLGFRGEALAAIASVSRVRAITRARAEATGTQLRMDAGQLVAREGIGAPPGTVIAVEDLFFNMPARLKFLKSESSERTHMARLLARYALAYPLVRFALQFDGREVFQATGGGAAREALLAAYGAELARALLEIQPQTADGIEVRGFVSPPEQHRANRRELTFFVNGRWVQDQQLSTAVLQAYHTLLPGGRYPTVMLQLQVAPAEVDVNVHPAKAEVRFRAPDAIFRAVGRAVRGALLQQAPVAAGAPREWSNGPQPGLGDWSWKVWSGAGAQPPNANAASHPPAAPAAQPEQTSALPALERIPLLRVLGQVGLAYVVAEGPDGLYLIDQHAAHERVLYEAFLAQAAGAQVSAQALLQPATVEVSPAAAGMLRQQLATLNALGFDISEFGASAFLVRAIPTVLGPVDATRAVSSVVDELEEDESLLAQAGERRIIARVCKRASVKAGQALSPAEQQQLVRGLEACSAPRTCPHGRPTMIHLSVSVLERQFGRK